VSETKRPHCGNCKHFSHHSPLVYGWCGITLPPWVPEPEGQSRSVHRAHVCDLHKPKEVQP
jgi:hypothetical protein